MTDYEQLVKALRCGEYKPECGSSDCPYWSGLGCMDGQLMEDAADAIEKLVTLYEKAEIDATNLTGKLAQAEAQLPKRGKIVRCRECKWYAPLDRKRPFFCPVMDCATGVMGDDFCSRGERRAKMEVHDETEI